MPKTASRYYWWCQISGWGFLALVLVLFSSTVYDQKITGKLIGFSAVVVFSGILTTHLFREVLRCSGWLLLPVEKAFPKLLIGVLVACFIDSLIRMGIVDALDISPSKKKIDFLARLLATTFDNGLFIIPWTLIY